jgi:hypothetical protein
MTFEDMNQLTVNRNPLYVSHVRKPSLLYMVLKCMNKPTGLPKDKEEKRKHLQHGKMCQLSLDV